MVKRLKVLRFRGVYEYNPERTLKEVMEFLVGCGVHNIEIVDGVEDKKT